jgi:hypothetical protein
MVAVATLMLHSCGANPQVTDNEESTVAHSQITEVKTTNPANDHEIYLNIVKDILITFYSEYWTPSNYKYSYLPLRGTPHFKQLATIKAGPFHYQIEDFSKSNIVLRETHHSFWDSMHEFPYPVKICIKKSDSPTYLVDVYEFEQHSLGDPTQKHKNIVYDKEGNRITLQRQIRENESKLLLLLKDAEIIREEHKDIFAAILSSKNVSDIEYIENNDNIEVFCNNDECSYRFLLKRSTQNNGYWGIINKMGHSAELQTNTAEGSSSIYAIKISDKSTSTKRLIISVERIVQNDMNNESDNQKKYGEASNTHHIVNEYKVASSGGIFSGDVEILPTNEDTFTKKYLSEISENVVYTYTDGALKINGRDAYQGKKHKL